MSSVKEKRCSKCQQTKALAEFNRYGKGHQRYCRECSRLHFKIYLSTEAGIAAVLRRDHGYPLEDSKILAPLLKDDESRCSICGMPNWLVRLNHKKGGPFFLGTPHSNSRMHPDRINTKLPHTYVNTRLLCPTCNHKRGDERHTDAEVLRWVRKRWLSIFPPRLLFWMHDKPGEGGRDHRNPNAK